MSKQEDTRFDKLKQFLGIKGHRGNQNVAHIGNYRPHAREFVFTQDRLKDISSQTPTQQRLKNLRDLCEVVSNKTLEQNAVDTIWHAVRDLLKPQAACEERHVALKFLQCLVKGQYESLGVMRAHFFQVIKGHALFEDLSPRLDLLVALSNDGRDLEYFEEDLGPFLLEWMRDVMSSRRISDFLHLLINIIKYNAAYLDESIVAGLVMHTCSIASKTEKEENVELCLKVLDTVICYSHLPQSSLDYFIVCLCQVFNVEPFSQDTWQLMRKLLGTHLGHSAIHSMCGILQESSSLTGSGALLLRGAVFFISMALWGTKKVSSLKYPPSAVLPSFLQSLTQCGAPVLANEIVLSIERLVNKYGKEQSSVTWDLILDIITTIFSLIEVSTSVSPVVVSNLHNLLTAIETLHERGDFHGSTARFFSIIETCAHKRPENSILMLVSYKVQDILPSVKDNWILKLDYLVVKYFKQEVRTKIRLKVLESLRQIISRNKYLYETVAKWDTLLELVVLPHLCDLDQEADTEVKVKVIELLVWLAESGKTVWLDQLLGLINKVISRLCKVTNPPLSPTLSGSEQRLHERPRSATMDTEDVMPAIHGLVALFRSKLYESGCVCLSRVYVLLYEHLQAHYSHTHILLQTHTGAVRHKIFELFLELRADCCQRLGLLDKHRHLAYSSHVYCTQHTESYPTSQAPESSEARTDVIIPYAQVFKCIRLCLEKENNWLVLKLVLESLPLVLRNKTLLLAADHEDVDIVCAKLCVMVSDRNTSLPEKLHVPAQQKLNKSDFHSYIFPVLTCLVSYHTLLDKSRQHELVRCLEFGLVSRCARICVRALTVCALEMQEVMMRQLPAVLLKLSQISATVAMAIPLMEFLSSLIQTPHLYSNFVEDQYMSVFAVALPYTNPFKYSHYTVSLAYNVVGLWFIKCRLPFRKGFVGFIIKNLRSNVLRQLKELEVQRSSHIQNQDSADRFRTQSLNEEALRSEDGTINKDSRSRAAAASARAKASTPVSSSSSSLDAELCMFHKELMETCVDMLARYTFSTRATLPKRSAVADFLLNDGQHQSWMLGNCIITITTSGGAKVGRAGLCEQCLLEARAATRPEGGPPASPHPPDSVGGQPATRRRHKSAAVKSLKETIPLKPLSRDDSSLTQAGPTPGELGQILEQRAPSSESLPRGQREQALLETSTERIQAMDSVLMGLRPKPTEKSIFSPNLCNCWCTQWAEIHVRRPTGALSWMMRIQNEETISDAFPLVDVSSLFMPSSGGKAAEDDRIPVLKREDEKIDSSKLAEKEYENLLEEHFNGDAEAFKKTNKMFMIGLHGDEAADSDVFITETSDPQNTADDHLQQHDDSFIRKAHSNPEFNQNNHTLQHSINPLTKPAPDTTGNNSKIDPPKLQAPPKPDPTPMKDASPPNRTSTNDSPKRNEPGRLKTPSSSTTSFNSIPEEGGTTGIRSAPRSPVESPGGSMFGGPRVPLPNVPSGGAAAHALFGKEGPMQGGINPSFLFLQMYHSSFFGSTEQKPLLLPQTETVKRSMKMLDMIYPFQTHKIGVVYVGKGQAEQETSILSNQYGSPRYMDFLDKLGSLVCLKDCSPETTYLGGLDNRGGDGTFAYSWQDEVTQIVFHVATLMPNKDSDKHCTQKKLHIGNDYVTLVYNDSGQDYRMGTIKCQFNYVNVIVQPLDHNTNAVTVQTREDIEDVIGHTDTKIISDAHLSTLARQMAVHADLASIILQKQKSNSKDLFASNWLERLRQVKRIRSKAQTDTKSPSSAATSSSLGGSTGHKSAVDTSPMSRLATVSIADDFTEYVH